MIFPRISRWALLVSACLAPGMSASPPARSAPAAAAAHPGPHWAYQPLANPEPPAVQNTRWAQSPIDRFVLAPLEAAGRTPAADADPATLARRLAFDLTGLPPTPEELAAFVDAARRDRAAAVAALADRLLASPRFGEHWGRHWLDVARFGESVTLRGFVFREAWRYRDYVIDAFNEDRPFHEFAREQIAGDLLSTGSDPLPVRQRRLIATTFLALGNTNLEEQDKGQLELDVVDEQLDTLGKAFLGQTLGCARCHDHKFDPIPTRDYYAMAGILRNARLLKHANVSEWLETPLPVSPEEEAALQRHEAALAVVEAELKDARAAAKAPAAGARAATTAGAGPKVLDPSDLPGLVVDSRRARTVGEWKHSSHSGRYIGDGYWHDLNRDKGSKTLSFAPEQLAAGRYEVRLAYIPSANRATNVPVTVFHADGETVVTINQQRAPDVQGRFAVLGRFRFESNGFANVLVGTEQTQGHVTADAVQFLPLDLADAAPPGAPAADGADARLASLEARLRELRGQGPRRPMVMTVREVEQPADRTIQVRGQVHNPGAVVPRGFLTATPAGPPPAIPEGQSGRRQLADWLASADHPLTARVYVNRVWAWLVGEGLVRSVDNFGTTGDAPTHPELLDYLARQFMAEGGSTKRLIRGIVRSRTYQLAAGPAADPDPDNRGLARAFRKRLRAEQLRDAMLAVSGRLDLDPPRGPTFPRERTADYGFVATSPQRSVYLPVFRNALPEIFETFDFAPTSLVTGRRQESIVPTQALFLLNHPFMREQAGAAARRLLAANAPAGKAADDARLRRAWEQTLGRPPTPAEAAVARAHLADLDPAEAWTEVYHALFAHADFRHLD